MRELLSKEVDEFVVQEIINAKSGGVEGSWVEILDLVQANCKILHEKLLGNSLLAKEVHSTIYYLNELKKDLSGDEYIIERDFITKFIEYILSFYDEKHFDFRTSSR
jgi:hypothetical protein